MAVIDYEASDPFMNNSSSIQLISAPEHGTVAVKQGKVTATNYKQCLAVEVPAFIAFYRSRADFAGVDVITLEVKYPGGKLSSSESALRLAPDRRGAALNKFQNASPLSRKQQKQAQSCRRSTLIGSYPLRTALASDVSVIARFCNWWTKNALHFPLPSVAIANK